MSSARLLLQCYRRLSSEQLATIVPRVRGQLETSSLASMCALRTCNAGGTITSSVRGLSA